MHRLLHHYYIYFLFIIYLLFLIVYLFFIISLITYWDNEIIIEVSTLGLIADISDFTNALKIPIMPDDLKRSIVIAALKSSFGIYLQQE